MNFNPLPADKFSCEVTYGVLSVGEKVAGAVRGAWAGVEEAGLSGAAAGNSKKSLQPELQLLVGDADKTFSLASVTKPIAAYAILVGVEQGDFSLDDAAGPAGSTLRHLLAHASGLPSSPGAPIAQPGKRRIYSNYGFDVLATWVEERAGVPISQYLIENVLAPLEMDGTEITGSIAYSGRSTLDSLLRFAGELLNPTLISSELFELATSVAFDGIPGILPGYGRQANNTWGLGFEIRSQKQPHWLAPDFSPSTFGHFGQSGSFLWVDLEVGKAGAFLSSRKFGAEHLNFWSALTAQMRAL